MNRTRKIAAATLATVAIVGLGMTGTAQAGKCSDAWCKSGAPTTHGADWTPGR